MSESNAEEIVRCISLAHKNSLHVGSCCCDTILNLKFTKRVAAFHHGKKNKEQLT
jgi:hypothetical protein